MTCFLRVKYPFIDAFSMHQSFATNHHTTSLPLNTYFYTISTQLTRSTFFWSLKITPPWFYLSKIVTMEGRTMCIYMNLYGNYCRNYYILALLMNTSCKYSEDPDEMLHDASFHQGLHCLIRSKLISEKYVHFLSKF